MPLNYYLDSNLLSAGYPDNMDISVSARLQKLHCKVRTVYHQQLFVEYNLQERIGATVKDVLLAMP